MSGVVRWVSLGALVVFIALAVASVVGRNNSSRKREIDREHPTYRLYTGLGCIRCHGPSMNGTHRGPALESLDKHWTESALAAFILAPDSLASLRPRLRELTDRFPDNPMPSYPIPDDHRILLARFLLELR